MSAPVASPADLQTYLGLDTIDTNRAALILDLAQSLCETITTPLPSTARAVVLGVAARAFNNVSSATSIGLGSAHASYGAPGSGIGVGGLYLSRQDKANLRRLNGGTLAFSINTLPTGTNAVQSVTLVGSPTGGTFTLSFAGQTTAAIAFNAGASAVQSALTALNVVGQAGVTVTGSGPWMVTFVGPLATTPVPMMASDSTGLTGGSSPLAVVAVVTEGVRKPGQDLPPWDWDYYGRNGYNHYIPGGYP